MNKLLSFLILFSVCSCSHNTTTEKYQEKRDKIINVQNKLVEMKLESILIGSIAIPQIICDYLIICDYKSVDQQIHLFDKNDFQYITSCAYRGQGPGEIANIGHIGINEKNREFYVTDHGKQCIFTYELDSVLKNPDYLPQVKLKMKSEQFLDQYQYLNDTISIGRIIEPTGNSGYNQSVAKFNINTGEIIPMKYTNPNVEEKRTLVAASLNDSIYVECYTFHDLITICSLDGDIKYNIYGPKWNKQTSNNLKFYNNIVFCGDKIVTTCAFGKDIYSEEPNPTAFVIFNKNGDYIETLETGHQISHFCYDKQSNRIIINLNNDIQFAYLDLNKDL